MARIPDAEIQRLKAEVSLVSLAEAAGVTLRRTGGDLTGCCPFHEDDTPSLVISPERNLWHCLGSCQAGGSVIDWVMRAEGVSFRHAVELLRDGLPAITPAGRSPGRSTARRLASPVDRDAADDELLGYQRKPFAVTPGVTMHCLGGVQEVTSLTKRNPLPRWMLINGQSAGLHKPADPKDHRLGRGHVMTPIQSDPGYRSAAESAGWQSGPEILRQR